MLPCAVFLIVGIFFLLCNMCNCSGHILLHTSAIMPTSSLDWVAEGKSVSLGDLKIDDEDLFTSLCECQ
ncbi:hypothetical protein Y032_0329g2664 [Ancylostoma ceylanicum]|uniref:Ig-like domain-containing protein n=1 Tax=Ancylostoma ceylanicum TaxID=53326 RepID=A0A016RZJ7_9BILA|nr:hypothetical protein Y032_0329g2664 [Ancylostoma ceylanicum]